MKLVTFSEPVAPYGVGDTRLVPDDVAEQLKSEGLISDSQPWPEPLAAQKPVRPVLKPTRSTGVSDKRLAR